MRPWTNRYWPRSGDRGSASRTISSCWARWRRCDSTSAEDNPETAASASAPKESPITDASWSRLRSRGSRPSRRAAMRAWSDSGTASLVRSPTGRYVPSVGWRRPSLSSMRIVSTAYSGIPSARATITLAAPSGRPGTRPARSSSISASVSGSRPSDVKPRWPAPHVGRRSRSSGRARVMT